MISSASPSLKYSCSRSALRFANGQHGDRRRRVGSSACQVLQGLPDVGHRREPAVGILIELVDVPERNEDV